MVEQIHQPVPAAGARRDEPAPGPDPGPEVVGLVCPECGEDAIERPPDTLVPYETHELAVPVYSHPDGEPLCPVIGPRGYRPADPVEVHADDTPGLARRVEDLHARITNGQADDVANQQRLAQLTRWHVADEGGRAGADDSHGRGWAR